MDSLEQTDQPEQPTVLCPVCAPVYGPHPLLITLADNEVRCPTCRRRYGIVSRQLHEVRSERLANGQVRYLLETREENGRTRPRNLDAQPQLYLRGGNWITLLSRGNHLLGIANQSFRLWYPIQPHITNPRQTRIAKVVSSVCLVLVVLQLTRFFPRLVDLFRNHGTSALLALLVLVVIGLTPALVWAIQAAGGPESTRRRYLPGFRDDLDDV